jgi:hypothetical protein
LLTEATYASDARALGLALDFFSTMVKYYTTEKMFLEEDKRVFFACVSGFEVII